MQGHAAKFNAYEGLCRKDKIMELKKSLSSQQNLKKIFIYLFIYLFIYRQRGKEGEREGEKHQFVVASRAPHWGPGLQPRHVP